MIHAMHKITRTLTSKKFCCPNFLRIFYFRADHRSQFGGSHLCVVTNKSTAALGNGKVRFTRNVRQTWSLI